MSTDAKWIVGTGVALAGLIVTVAMLILQQSNFLRDDIRSIRDDIRSMDARLRMVEQVQAQHSIWLGQLVGEDGLDLPALHVSSNTLKKNNLSQ